jgi:hypothetical protein
VEKVTTLWPIAFFGAAERIGTRCRDRPGSTPSDWNASIEIKRSPKEKRMSPTQPNYFDASLPGIGQAVRIATYDDAKVFVRRWVIRDKDPALKALLRHMEKANSIATADTAIGQLLQALSSRGLLGLASP